MYRFVELGVLVKLDPKAAVKQIMPALQSAAKNLREPGRVVNLAAEKLGVGKSSLWRWLTQLEASGHVKLNALPNRPRGRRPKKAPTKKN